MGTSRRLDVGRALVAGRWVGGDVEVDAHGEVLSVGLVPNGRGARADRSAVAAFVDLQVNGRERVDARTADPAGFAALGTSLLQSGVAAYRPTLHSCSVAGYVEALGVIGSVLGAADRGSRGAAVLPAHLEGPFLNEMWAGAHDRHRLSLPSNRVLDQLLGAGPIGMMTIAPELPGALEVVARLRREGVTVAMGHTDATAEQARAAIDAGVTMLTHCFNAHRRFRPRDPGPAGVALTDRRCSVGLICDLVHLAPETLSMACAVAGDRVVMVTDAVATGPEIRLVDGRAQLEDGTIAGGVSTMADGVRNLVALGVSLEAAVHAAATGPAQLAGLGPWDLSPGSGTVALVLDDRLEVAAPAGSG